MCGLRGAGAGDGFEHLVERLFDFTTEKSDGDDDDGGDRCSLGGEAATAQSVENRKMPAASVPRVMRRPPLVTAPLGTTLDQASLGQQFSLAGKRLDGGVRARHG